MDDGDHNDAASPAGELPLFAADGTDLALIRQALAMTPADRLRAFEVFMADIVKMLDAANRT